MMYIKSVKNLYFAIVGLLILSGCMTTANSGLLQEDVPYGQPCILRSEMRFGDVQPDMAEAALISTLGKPLERQLPPFGGDIPIDAILIYDGLEVMIRLDQVGELTATDQNWSTPSGLRPGLTQQQLFDILGGIPTDVSEFKGDTIYSMSQCYVDEQYSLHTYFDFSVNKAGQVTSISIERTWP